jgi:hypothetical protein
MNWTLLSAGYESVDPSPNTTPLAVRSATSARPSLSRSYTVTPSQLPTLSVEEPGSMLFLLWLFGPMLTAHSSVPSRLYASTMSGSPAMFGRRATTKSYSPSPSKSPTQEC